MLRYDPMTKKNYWFVPSAWNSCGKTLKKVGPQVKAKVKVKVTPKFYDACLTNAGQRCYQRVVPYVVTATVVPAYEDDATQYAEPVEAWSRSMRPSELQLYAESLSVEQR